MKKIIYLIIMITFITGCSKNDNISDIIFTNIDDCNQKPEFLISKNDKTIYTYCISNIKIKINNKEINLKEYIDGNNDAIDKIIETLTMYDVCYDGGTTLYKNNNVSLIACNTLDGNKDIYIGNKTMNHKENFCKNNNYTFIRTYFMEDLEYDSYNSYKLKLKSADGITQNIIVINPSLAYLEKNKTYEFEFMLNENVEKVEDNIKFIFDNSKIVEIRETNKDIKEHINEEIR